MFGIWYFVIYAFVILILWAIEHTRKILINSFPELIFAVSSFFLLMSDIKSSSEDKFVDGYSWKDLNLFFIILGSVMFFVGLIFSYKRNIKIEKLHSVEDDLHKEKQKNEMIKNEFFALCNNNIKDIFSDFYSSSNGNSRVSLYKHQGDKFVLLGRYSDNPAYSKSGLEQYNDDEGFIAKGWQSKIYEIHSIPQWKQNGSSYKSFMKINCKIDDIRLKGLTMKSRSFYVYRLDSDTSNPYGVIVFEKMENSQINTNLIDNIFTHHKPQIINLLKSMKTIHE